MLSSNISSTCPHNMVNFGPLAAENCWRVWGTPANFNGFRVLIGSVTALLSSSQRQRNFAALNRGRHLWSAGHPSRWALAHILVIFFFSRVFSAVADWMCTIQEIPYTWCGLSAHLACRSERGSTRVARNTGRKNSPSGHHHTTLSGSIFAIKARIDNRRKAC